MPPSPPSSPWSIHGDSSRHDGRDSNAATAEREPPRFARGTSPQLRHDRDELAELEESLFGAQTNVVDESGVFSGETNVFAGETNALPRSKSPDLIASCDASQALTSAFLCEDRDSGHATKPITRQRAARSSYDFDANATNQLDRPTVELDGDFESEVATASLPPRQQMALAVRPLAVGSEGSIPPSSLRERDVARAVTGADRRATAEAFAKTQGVSKLPGVAKSSGKASAAKPPKLPGVASPPPVPPRAKSKPVVNAKPGATRIAKPQGKPLAIDDAEPSDLLYLDQEHEARQRAGASDELGPYLLHERIGSGGMGSVHRAELRGIAGFRKSIALKRMWPHLATDMHLVQSFIQEARLASMLRHHNIVQAYDFGKLGGTYYIAMELVHGHSLHAAMKQADRAAGAIPLAVTIDVLVQLCEALEYAHGLVDDNGRSLGIIHRDVSPANVLMSDTGVVKLIDFGVAKSEQSSVHTEVGVIKGKLAYVAPEYTEGHLDARADLWSVGVIAYEMLAGQRLFIGEHEYETLRNVREKPIYPPSRVNPQISRDLDDIVLVALQRDPAKRWQSATALRNALVNVARDLGIVLGGAAIREWCDWAFAQQPRKETGIVRVLDVLANDRSQVGAVASMPLPSLAASHAPPQMPPPVQSHAMPTMQLAAPHQLRTQQVAAYAAPARRAPMHAGALYLDPSQDPHAHAYASAHAQPYAAKPHATQQPVHVAQPLPVAHAPIALPLVAKVPPTPYPTGNPPAPPERLARASGPFETGVLLVGAQVLPRKPEREEGAARSGKQAEPRKPKRSKPRTTAHVEPRRDLSVAPFAKSAVLERAGRATSIWVFITLLSISATIALAIWQGWLSEDTFRRLLAAFD